MKFYTVKHLPQSRVHGAESVSVSSLVESSDTQFHTQDRHSNEDQDKEVGDEKGSTSIPEM